MGLPEILDSLFFTVSVAEIPIQRVGKIGMILVKEILNNNTQVYNFM